MGKYLPNTFAVDTVAEIRRKAREEADIGRGFQARMKAEKTHQLVIRNETHEQKMEKRDSKIEREETRRVHREQLFGKVTQIYAHSRPLTHAQHTLMFTCKFTHTHIHTDTHTYTRITHITQQLARGA
jgi:hypothetical protein